MGAGELLAGLVCICLSRAGKLHRGDDIERRRVNKSLSSVCGGKGTPERGNSMCRGSEAFSLCKEEHLALNG